MPGWCASACVNQGRATTGAAARRKAQLARKHPPPNAPPPSFPPPTISHPQGYPAEKARFLGALVGGAADAGKPKGLNAIVLGGDSHNAWCEKHTGGGGVVG